MAETSGSGNSGLTESDNFERRIEYRPAYHRVKEGNGVGDVRLLAVLKGQKGTLVLHMGTGWFLPETWKWWQETGRKSTLDPKRFGEGHVVDFHSRERKYEGLPERESCEFVDGAPCFTDSGYLMAEPIAAAFISLGEAGLWAEMEETYHAYYDRESEDA